MPEITPIGWLHTAMGAIAILSGAFTLFRHRQISLARRSGQLYLATTLITAVTALFIFQRGTFGPGHALAVMTLLALGVGVIAETLKPFGPLSRYLQALGYSSTLLFHSIPAITDGLLRLPVGDPVLTSIEDPVLKVCYAVLLSLFLLGAFFQLRWLRAQPVSDAGG